MDMETERFYGEGRQTGVGDDRALTRVWDPSAFGLGMTTRDAALPRVVN
jgi:hypothetical protein